MVLPGMASHSPAIQSRMWGWAISAGVSWARGEETMSSMGSGRCLAANSLTRLAMSRKMSQSLLDSQQGGTAADSGLMKLCMSVELRSVFSYQVAVGSTMSL